MKGFLDTIMAAYYGHGGLNNYSVHPGLWNERLGLPVEELDETDEIVAARLYAGVDESYSTHRIPT